MRVVNFPIFTVENDCQDCYKCVRACPVKAIQIENGHAQVLSELCVLCGECVEVCPVGAKKVREDLSRARELTASARPVFASLAPSWVGEFPGVSVSAIVGAMKRLGFAGVGETALGAQEVTGRVARLLSREGPGLYLSTACPSAVKYVQKYFPRLVPSLTPVASPLLAHARLLRAAVGGSPAVVFFGPCIAKKWESDCHPGEIDVVLTFQDLRDWLEESGIDMAGEGNGGETFFPETAEEGAHYPIEGGMVRTIREAGTSPEVRFVTLSGLDNIRRGLQGLDPSRLKESLFVECLACPGGCINGPLSHRARSTLERWIDVENYAPDSSGRGPRPSLVEVGQVYAAEEASPADVSEEELLRALRSVGKYCPDDEMNCGGCGYETCREFARALVVGRAEPTMCVSYMRKKAQKKANALLRSMPSGVVIVDQDLKIIECNERFARLFGEETFQIYSALPGMKGCVLSRIIPFDNLFQGVLETGQDVHYDHFRHGDMLFEITVFAIEPHQTVGAVILDVTRREVRRDQIAQRANEVIEKNLATVQDIACKLGEHMADTEILLRSIAEGYATEDPELEEV